MIICCLLSTIIVKAQAPEPCKVNFTLLSKRYEGECKKGIASGKGEAWGEHHYIGEFKNGMPNGKGTYHYNDNESYTGNMQDGLREGKGQMTYKIKDKEGTPKDSIVEGYWSGDIFRGKSYTTYQLSGGSSFSSYEISPSHSSGNQITFEISSTSGNPVRGSGIYVQSLVAYYDNKQGFSKIISTFDSNNTSFTNVQIGGFPAKIQGRLTDGTNFELELYKSANWKIRFYINK